MSLAIDRDKPQPADKPTLYKQIRLDIERRILTGEWPPGHRIPFEHELMARLSLLANDGQQSIVRTGASRSDRAAAAGRHLCAPSEIPVGSPDRFPISARKSPRLAEATAIS